MSIKLSVAEARAHLPLLVLSHYIYKKIHGDSVMGRINTRLAVGITKVVWLNVVCVSVCTTGPRLVSGCDQIT